MFTVYTFEASKVAKLTNYSNKKILTFLYLINTNLDSF